ncbi:MAG TPA: sulfatase-like hydrolase/transferase, partial [Phycisphaerae bacterium]|nr:sulfatase-like hydrolase/transferase [Phycisphaerae bacterium]
MNARQGIRRRELLRAAAAGAALAALGPRLVWAGETGPKSERRSNILLVISDEHNASVTGCYGNATVRTPNLDALASRGIAFDAAYTNSPLCVPSRLAVTAGKYISRTGAWSNDCRLPSDEYPSLARILSAAGYEPYLCGKMHYDARRRYGFTEIGGNMNNNRKTGRGRRRAADDTRINTASRDSRFADFHAGEGGSIKHDLKVTAGVLEFLSKRGRTEKPFFLLAGYLTPHFPLTVPQEYWDPYKGKIPMPELPAGHVESQPLNYHHLRRGFGIVETDPNLVRIGRELYYGLTSWCDNQVGLVLKALADAGLADNTAVIYTTDHGENMGEHHLWWKNCMYDTAARVPLVVSWPERWKGGQRRAGACGLVDVVRTIADIGGATAPDDWNGASLCPRMDDPKAAWRDLAVSEYYAHNIASGYV